MKAFTISPPKPVGGGVAAARSATKVALPSHPEPADVLQFTDEPVPPVKRPIEPVAGDVDLAAGLGDLGVGGRYAKVAGRVDPGPLPKVDRGLGLPEGDGRVISVAMQEDETAAVWFR